MSKNEIGKTDQQLVPIFTTKVAKAQTTETLVADTASNIALDQYSSFVSLKTAIDDVVYVKYKTAVGDADVTTTNYDDVILGGEIGIDRDIYKETIASVNVKTTHISILSATAGDVFVIER